jgi:hypothetical protein
MARPRPVPGLPVSSRAPRVEQLLALGRSGIRGRRPRRRFDFPAFGRVDGHEYPPMAIFGGILDQVAEHFVEVLAFDLHLGPLSPAMSIVTLLIEPVDRSLDRLDAVPDAGRAWAEARRPIALARAR